MGRAFWHLEANRVFSFLRAVCRWAKKLGSLADNPMERVLGDEEVFFLWAATENEKPTVKAAVRLLFLLGQRTTETLMGLRWDGLDLDADIPVWTIPGSFRKGERLHTVPLPKAAVEIIKALRPTTGTTERVLDVLADIKLKDVVCAYQRLRDIFRPSRPTGRPRAEWRHQTTALLQKNHRDPPRR
jgi:integrase